MPPSWRECTVLYLFVFTSMCSLTTIPSSHYATPLPQVFKKSIDVPLMLINDDSNKGEASIPSDGQSETPTKAPTKDPTQEIT